ncbi:hypothetical protein Trydic_g16034 [Trypoxylus dichotomus]
MANNWYIVLFFVAAVIVSTCSRGIGDKHLELFKQQTLAVEQFRCQPRPRSFRIAALHSAVAHDDSILPLCAVLHRCDRHSGCCPEKDRECAVDPEAVQIVKLAFFSQKFGRIVTFEAKNHTSCVCQELSDGAIKK